MPVFSHATFVSVRIPSEVPRFCPRTLHSTAALRDGGSACISLPAPRYAQQCVFRGRWSSRNKACRPRTLRYRRRRSLAFLRLVRREDRDLLDFHILIGPVAERVRFHLADGLDDVHAFDYLAEYRVMAVEPLGLRQRDEELRAAGVRACIRHREDALAAVPKIRMELVGNRIAGAAGAVAFRAAALDHEAIDDAMEDQAVVKAFLDQHDEIARGLRRLVLKQLDVERPLACLKSRDTISHLLISSVAVLSARRACRAQKQEQQRRRKA